jgi:MFS family permease
MYAVSFFDSLSYYAFSYALILHLGLEVGLPDSVAGIFYGLFGVSISIATLILGFAADILGIRSSICISAAIGFVSRLGMAYAVLGRSAWLSACFLFILIGPSIALIGPPIPTAIKRYTTSKTNPIGFAINYGVTNVAAFIATPIIDLIRLHVQDDLFMLPPYALLIAISALLQLPIFFVTLFYVKDVNLFEDGSVGPMVSASSALTVKDRIRGVVAQTTFWRAMVLVTCLIGVKSSFRYFDALYLPYVMRAYQVSRRRRIT